ncbi:MAG: hypothetical protein M0D57_13790 [Sphingobacteriales bacterium JAD_PAG50586_3]|nr:MAG: hypothetical protein M0D57_13790 [Sphingobacteriales bacterium JAD_PAG50586_3]
MKSLTVIVTAFLIWTGCNPKTTSSFQKISLDSLKLLANKAFAEKFPRNPQNPMYGFNLMEVIPLDYDSDGFDDVVILFNEDTGGSIARQSVSLFKNANNKLVYKQAKPFDGIFDKSSIKDKTIILKTKTWGVKDPVADPTVIKEYTISFDNDTISGLPQFNNY